MFMMWHRKTNISQVATSNYLGEGGVPISLECTTEAG